MISIEYLRNNYEEAKKSLSSKGTIDGLDEIISIDKDYRKILMSVNDLRADRNKTSDEIAELKKSGEDANVILGCVIDPDLTDEIRITVIATGLNDSDYPDFYENDTEIDFKEKYSSHSTNIDEEESMFKSQLEEKNNIKEIENEDDIYKSDIKEDSDLDIPTFLRNNRS